MPADLGRQVKYGLAKETTFGTGVAPVTTANQLSFTLAPVVEYAQNISAYGNIIKTNNASILHQHAAGDFECKLTSNRSLYFLLGAMGTVVTTSNPDASGVVKTHTVDISENINGQSFTFTRKDGLTTKQYAGGRVSNFSLSMELGDYIKYSGSLLTRKATTTTWTPAYTNETEFTPKDFTVKTATNAAGLAGATAIASLESFTLNINGNLEPDWQAGSVDPYAFSSRGFDLDFEMTVRYDGTVYEDAYTNGTGLALQVNAINQAVTIGTAAKPGLTFTAPFIHITDWTRNEDLDSPVTQTMTGTIHYSQADAYALRAVATNLQASY